MTHDGFTQTTCWKCKCIYYLPNALYTAARHSPNIDFWCPYGHSAHFPAGETEADKMRRERDRAVQEQARLAEQLKAVRTQRDQAQEVVARHKRTIIRHRKRALAALCPCCNRSFANMTRHIKSKHPDQMKLLET